MVVGKKVCSLFSVGLNELVSVCHIMRRKYWKLGNLVTENDDTLTLTTKTSVIVFFRRLTRTLKIRTHKAVVELYSG